MGRFISLRDPITATPMDLFLTYENADSTVREMNYLAAVVGANLELETIRLPSADRLEFRSYECFHIPF